MQKKFLEKKRRKYVIATLDTPTLYLISLNGQYCFTQDIERATKTMTRGISEYIKREFYYNTGVNFDLVVIPLEITYELIEENYDKN